jgi:regulator of ribonuclease activity A
MDTPATADLCDTHGEDARVVALAFRDLGGRRRFAGTIATLRVHEDNALVRAELGTPGAGRVLVVDGGGSTRTALVGDQLAALAVENGWAGIVVNGAIRDAEAIGGLDLGAKALGTCPRKSAKKGWGEREIAVTFGGVTFTPGAWLAADADGVVVLPRPPG